jgi:hypothetical protein
MPDPSAAHQAHQAASVATDPATLGAWAALIAAIGLAWRRIAGRGTKPAAAPGPTLAQQVGDQGNQIAGLGHLYQRVSEEIAEVRDQLRAMPTKEDLRDLVERLEGGLKRLEDAGERRVARLHARIDDHVAQHGRPTA